MTDLTPKIRIVGIGASAGGLESLKTFFTEVPADSGFAFVIIQHLDPNRESLMAELLSKHTKMAVTAARDQVAVEANHVYTIPPNKFLFVKDAALHLADPFSNDGARMPIDFFLRSLASDQEASSIAVLFSGGGSDGTLGIREIHGAGGLVIVQDPETAQHQSMVENAIATGLVDYVLPAREIPAKLIDYVRHRPSIDTSDTDSSTGAVDGVLNLLATDNKHDFRAYKKNTVRRRIERRMGIHHISELSEYYDFVRGNSEELAKLAKDLIISVTSFFRDPEAFKELLDKVIAPLVQEHDPKEPLRVWIPGCATGEEAYSIVILLLEEMARASKNTTLQVFASDIDREALKRARHGIYPESISVDISPERLATFFIKQDGAYRVDQRVRDCVTFAEHNLILDPPFMRLDLVSCRNLLIYIEPAVQEKIVNLLAFALKPSRYLFLGKADTPADRSEFFEAVSRTWRMFRRRKSLALPLGRVPPGVLSRQVRDEEPPPRRLGELSQDVLLQHFQAAMVMVNERGEILHFHGRTEKYLTHPVGDANLSLYDMIDRQYSLALRLGAERAGRENRQIELKLRQFNRQDNDEPIAVTISPVSDPRSGKRLLAVIFEAAAAAPLKEPVLPPRPVEQQDFDVFNQLQAENDRLKHDLQSAIENFQVTHEEFTAANEEVLAINEELQSTNEELETSKEELQSVNEEMITVNAQLNDKVEELTTAHDDLANLVNTSEVGTLFLDRACCIRRFTPSMTRILNLLPLDVGRPVNHIATRMIGVDLVAIAEAVLQSLSPYQQEVLTADRLWYMLYCVPYRTQNNVIDGLVFTFTDVTRLKHSEQVMRQARTFAENIIQTVSESLLVLDSELKIVSANQAFYRTFHVGPEDVEGRLIYNLGNRQWNIPKLRELLEGVMHRDGSFENFEVEHEFQDIGRKIMSLNCRKFSASQSDEARLILLAIDDITERRQAEAERSWLEGELRQAQKMESLGTLAAGIAHDFNNILNIVQGYAFVLRDSKIADELVKESVAAILDSTTRGATIVQQLLTLARKTEPKFDSLDIDALIEEVAQLFGKSSPHTIEIKLELSSPTPPILADRNQIFQALLNLCLNARDAMPNGGTLKLKTSLANCNAVRNTVAGSEEVTAEQYVRIDVDDTGEGIDENVLGRIFEPFFTTKGAGRGTGLGLAVVYGILKHHKGFINVTSKPGAGTSFQIYLPVTRRSD